MSVDVAEAGLEQLQTEQTWQVINNSLTLSLHKEKHARIEEYFLNLFGDNKLHMTLFSTGLYQKSVLSKMARSGFATFYGLNILRAFEALVLLDALSLVSSKA